MFLSIKEIFFERGPPLLECCAFYLWSWEWKIVFKPSFNASAKGGLLAVSQTNKNYWKTLTTNALRISGIPTKKIETYIFQMSEKERLKLVIKIV